MINDIVRNNNTAIVIVTYNPDRVFREVLNRCRELCENIVIVDNGSKNISEWNYLLTTRETIIINKQNLGIAEALNEGIQSALKLNIEWILTLDQDSIPCRDIFQLYSEILKKETGKINKIGLIGASYTDSKIKTEISYKRSLTLITSGLLHNISIFEDTGFYNSSYFIDYVDFEFSLRCNVKGYITYRIERKVLNHSLGNPKKKKFLIWNLQSTNHSAFRRYYMVRNTIWTSRLYWRYYPRIILIKNFHMLKSIILMMLVDDHKITKIRRIFKGFVDGYKKIK